MAFTALATPRTCASLARPARQATVACRAQGDASGSGRATRRVIVGTGVATTLVSVPMIAQAASGRTGEVKHTEKEWREILGDLGYNVMREEGTERPFSSPLNNEKRMGTFVCAGCDAPLFRSDTKYNSGTGWPSFYDVIPGSIDKTVDFKLFLPRTEVRCHRCQGHLGHVFEDGPAPTGLRYCMNGAALKFQEA